MKRTKTTDYQEAQDHGRGAGFVANVIRSHYDRPAKMLRALVDLLRAGSEVSMLGYHMDTISVDGKVRSLSSLGE